MTLLFFDATNALLYTLDLLSRALTEQRLPEAKALLEQAAPGVVRYLSQVDAAIGEMDSQIAALKTRATQLSAEIETSKGDLSALEGQITRVNGEIAGLDAKRANLALKNATLAPLIDALVMSVKVRKEKLDELKKWFWVPGYGQYLAIRTLVDEDITRLQSTQHDLRDNSRDLQRNENALAALRTSLRALSDQVRGMRNGVSQLQRIADRANLELARAKHRTAFLTDAKSFMAAMNAMAANFESFSLPRLSTILSQLGGRSLDSRMSVLNRQSNTFANDIREFAMAVDARASFLTYAPASGNAVEVANRGAFVLKTRIVSHRVKSGASGEALASPWSENILAGRSARMDVRSLALADNAVFWIEAAAALGPTLRSCDIRYIEQTTPEIARFTAAGTILSAGLHHEP